MYYMNIQVIKKENNYMNDNAKKQRNKVGMKP